MPVTPVLTKRAEQLGWLAATPPDYPYRFAVVGDTEDEARTNFELAVERWESIPDRDQAKDADRVSLAPLDPRTR